MCSSHLAQPCGFPISSFGGITVNSNFFDLLAPSPVSGDVNKSNYSLKSSKKMIKARRDEWLHQDYYIIDFCGLYTDGTIF